MPSGVISEIGRSGRQSGGMATFNLRPLALVSYGGMLGLMTSPANVPELPSILEIKHLLDGREKRFDCRLLSLASDGGHAAVLWVAPAAMHVHGVDLPVGTVSVGHFWLDRHYNVYHWLDRAGQTLGYYFNICDQTRIAGGLIEWRDLIVDVLAIPGSRLEVLDEHEPPPGPPADAAAHTAGGKQG